MTGEFEYVRAKRCSTTCRPPVAAVALLWLALVVLLCAVPWAEANEQAPALAGPGVLEVFVREGCPHCADAKVFLSGFSRERPWLKVVYRPVDRDKCVIRVIGIPSFAGGVDRCRRCGQRPVRHDAAELTWRRHAERRPLSCADFMQHRDKIVGECNGN